ncbi:MAG: hypothetical protein JKY88_17675 [Pseudomonadales bacterium]|nr:hypothetical protein [Pseudomonadales bacterium]
MTPQGTLTLVNIAWLYWLYIAPAQALTAYGVFLVGVIYMVFKNKYEG